MQIHGIHLQGIQSPPGEHRISFDPGYCFVEASDADEARAFLRLAVALLYPGAGPHALAREFCPVGESVARAGLSFTLGSDSYRVILDLAQERLLLGRFDGEGSYQRIATDPDKVRDLLAELGLPPLAVFAKLQVLGPITNDDEPTTGEIPTPELITPRVGGTGADGEASERASARGTVDTPPLPPPPAPSAAEEAAQAQLEVRVRMLRHSQRRLGDLERQQQELEAELDKRKTLREHVEQLDPRIERFRELSGNRTHDLAGVEAARRALLEERGRLRAVPQAQATGTWLGLGLGAAGALAGLLVQPLFYGVSLLGVGVALFTLALSSTARRRQGRVEARLAALRVREASVERRFESETAPVRSLLQALELESVDDIQRELADYQEQVRRLDEVRRERQQAEEAFPESALRELAELEADLVETPTVSPVVQPEPEPEPEPAETPTYVQLDVQEAAPASAPPAPTPTEGDPAAPRPPSLETLVRAAELGYGRAPSEVRERIVAVLPIYLRALTQGEFTRAWYSSSDGWSFRREGKGERVPFASTGADDRERLALAFRLALLEALAQSTGMPLLVGPELPAEEGGRVDPAILARALARLSRAAQLIQIAPQREPWAAAASSRYSLSK